MPNLERAFAIWQRINENPELKSLEKDGFARGEARGKSMDYPFMSVVLSLHKQIDDVNEVLDVNLDETNPDFRTSLKKALADLRNVAGCMFLKLQEEDTKEDAKTVP